MVKMRRYSGRRMASWLTARARSSTKARNLLIKTTEREQSSSVCDFSPTETLARISVELCPNGNRLWCPESRFADTDLSVPKIPSGAVALRLIILVACRRSGLSRRFACFPAAARPEHDGGDINEMIVPCHGQFPAPTR